jgi:hypothetical protein
MSAYEIGEFTVAVGVAMLATAVFRLLEDGVDALKRIADALTKDKAAPSDGGETK